MLYLPVRHAHTHSIGCCLLMGKYRKSSNIRAAHTSILKVLQRQTYFMSHRHEMYLSCGGLQNKDRRGRKLAVAVFCLPFLSEWSASSGHHAHTSICPK